MSNPRKTASFVSTASPQWPRHALGRACLLALAGFSSAAMGQTAVVSVTNASIALESDTVGSVLYANYGFVTGERQFGSGMLDASNTGVTMGSVIDGGGVSPISVSNNSLQSLAFGNQTASTSGLSLLTSSLLSANLQSLSGLFQPGESPQPDTVGSLSVSAKVSGSSAFITQEGMASADLALVGNTLAASTQLNVADTRVAGAVPSGFASGIKGGSGKLEFGSLGATIGVAGEGSQSSTGTVNLDNLQSTFSASPTAILTASNVVLTVSETAVVPDADASVFANAVSVNGNTLAATTGINTGTSLFTAQAASAAWTGSVSVTNLQNAAAFDGSTDSLASVSDSAVSADLRFGATGQTDLTGSLTLNDNQITASSVGNSAGARTTSGAMSAGNAITFEGGADITGSASGTGTSMLNTGTAQSVADLTLVNAQANASSNFVTSVDAAGVTSTIDNLAGGTLTQSGNAITASSTANLAGNLVSAGQGGSVANFTASVAALNVQFNNTLSSTASVEDSAVSAVVGIADAEPTGTATLSNNTLSATAEGNVGVTTVALKAANLNVSGTLGVGATQGVSLNPSASTASAGLGVVALSVQSNEGVGSALTATNEGTSVSLSFNEQDAVSTEVSVDAMSATLSGNLLKATATANSASNSATLEGTNGTGLSSAVGNSQNNSNLAVSANAGSTTPLAVGLNAGAVGGSTLSLTGNTLGAATTGNTASSSLNVTLSTASGSAVTATPEAKVEGWTSTAQADLALANSQRNASAVFTAAIAGGVSLAVGDVDAGGGTSSLTLSTNQIGATVEANRAANTMALDVGNLSGITAALASRQDISDSEATATTAGAVTLAAGDVGGAALAASGNALKSTVLGNAVNNDLSVTGTTATGVGTTLAAASAEATATDAMARADVSLANVQSSTGNELSALTGDLTTAAAVTMGLGAVSGASTLNLANNTIGATTSVNSASNALRLNITTVTGMTAGVASAQTTLSDAPAEAITRGLVGVDALSLTSSSATVSGNAIAASLFGNSADNTLSLTAAAASGRNGVPDVSVGDPAAGDFVVANRQQVGGVEDDLTLSALTTGAIELSAGTAGALTSSALTLRDNSISAYTGANSTNNQVALNVTDLSSATAGVASRQIIASAEVTSFSQGSVLLEGGDVTGSALTLSSNTVKSTSLGNVATNQVSVKGTNATGAGAVNSAASAAAGTAADVVADVAVANLQDSNGITLSATTVGAAGIAVGAVGSVDSTLTLSNNTTSALAQSNSASNTLALASTNLNGLSAGVASSQATDGSVGAIASSADPMGATSAAFKIAAGNVVGTPVVLSNNTFSAVAGMNEAFNTLTAAGASLLGRGSNAGPASLLGSAESDGVDFSVVNAQSGVGTVSALADPGTIGFTGSLGGGSLSILGNTVKAQASVNTASNQLSLAATNSLEARAVVNNVQFMDSEVSAIVVESTTEPSLLGATLTPGGSSAVAVSNNSVTAQATGNLAFNALNATAVSGIGSSVAGASDMPTYAVLNRQTTQGTATIEALLNGTSLGAALNGSGGITSVQGNQMVALAYGNSVDNVVGMSALSGGLNTASAAITSIQYNMASISAAVSGASMAASGTVSGAGSVNVSGNTITAQVVGNRSVNSITAR